LDCNYIYIHVLILKIKIQLNHNLRMAKKPHQSLHPSWSCQMEWLMDQFHSHHSWKHQPLWYKYSYILWLENVFSGSMQLVLHMFDVSISRALWLSLKNQFYFVLCNTFIFLLPWEITRYNCNNTTSISFPKTLGGYVILFVSHWLKINMKGIVAIVVIM